MSTRGIVRLSRELLFDEPAGTHNDYAFGASRTLLAARTVRLTAFSIVFHPITATAAQRAGKFIALRFDCLQKFISLLYERHKSRRRNKSH
jgi:hypothetical protein